MIPVSAVKLENEVRTPVLPVWNGGDEWLQPFKHTALFSEFSFKADIKTGFWVAGVLTLHSTGWLYIAMHNSCKLQWSVSNQLSVWDSDWGFILKGTLDCVRLTLLWGHPPHATIDVVSQESQVRALPCLSSSVLSWNPPLYNHSRGK